jgi:chemotaxis-related protein WspD
MAGRGLLEHDLPEQYANEWAEVMAAQKEDESSGADTVVIFRTGGEWFAIAAAIFAEIMDTERPHSIPGRKNPVLLGLINVHGELHLCVSLASLLGLDEEAPSGAPHSGYRRMIVLDRDGDRWVFPVDEIYGVQRIGAEAFQNVPATVLRGESTFTRAVFEWDGRNVALLDDGLLLSRLARSVQ